MPSTICKIALVAFVALSTTARADTYYLDSTQSGYTSTNWNILADWNSAANGTGSKPVTFTGNNFDLNGQSVGTSSGTTVFSGPSLTLDGGTLNLRNGGTKTIGSIFGTGSSEITFNQTGTTLTDTTFDNSGTTTFSPIGGSLTLTLDLGTLTGAGNFTLGGGTTIGYVLDTTSATGYTGDFTVGSGTNLIATLQFDAAEDFDGGLVATNATSRIALNQNVTFDSLTLNGTSLSPGTYSYSYLNGNYGTIFTSGGSGSITVASAAPEPATYALLFAGLGFLMVAARRRTA